jgi:hypothetical protein
MGADHGWLADSARWVGVPGCVRDGALMCQLYCIDTEPGHWAGWLAVFPADGSARVPAANGRRTRQRAVVEVSDLAETLGELPALAGALFLLVCLVVAATLREASMVIGS